MTTPTSFRSAQALFSFQSKYHRRFSLQNFLRSSKKFSAQLYEPSPHFSQPQLHPRPYARHSSSVLNIPCLFVLADIGSEIAIKAREAAAIKAKRRIRYLSRSYNNLNHFRL